jgi:hypothetical protein
LHGVEEKNRHTGLMEITATAEGTKEAISIDGRH